MRPENQHPVIRYATSALADHQVILDDPRTHGVLVVSPNYNITVVSLPEFRIDMTTGLKRLVGLLGNDCSFATPVALSGNFAKNILTLVPQNTEFHGHTRPPESDKEALKET